MTPDDFEPKKKSDVFLGAEDLSNMTMEELEDRISLLSAEIDRCHDMIKSKKKTRSAADSYFKL